MSIHFPARDYFPGMGEAVADRTVNRRIFTEDQRAALPETLILNDNDPLFKSWMNAAELSEYPVEISQQAKFMEAEPELRTESWADVAERVARGNTMLVQGGDTDLAGMRRLVAKGALLMSGRHLQHTDGKLKLRPMEVVTNCSSSAATFILFYLLLNGSGVGRAYDDAMMKVDWRNMPNVFVTIDKDHPDHALGRVPLQATTSEVVETAFEGTDTKVTKFMVPDSRGGWAKALEIIERMTYEERKDEVLILDFSLVRGYGQPIRGMQNRPSSGPGPLMDAIIAISEVKLLDLDPWEATMHVDHYAAQCVLVGGARRAARMATKTWRDKNVFGFIRFKSNSGFWTSNNSVTIDEEFRERCRKVAKTIGEFRNSEVQATPVEMLAQAERLFSMDVISDMDLHAWNVLVAIADASYFDMTGEPGIINQDRLNANDEGVEDYIDGLFAGSKDFQMDDDTLPLMRDLAKEVVGLTYTMITNPCGEITLLMLGAYCVIADVVPFHAESDDEAEEAFRMAARALMRTNTMDCLYGREVKRTNRIGIGMTGFHEWAYDRFGFTWHDIIDEVKSRDMWLMVSRFKRAIVDEVTRYAAELGVVVPHTDTTFKPAGTTSKLFGLTEGAHLPSMRWFLRWVQFRLDDPLIAEYEARGYPVRRDLKDYAGMAIVGFPTAPAICELGDGEWVVTAAEATPDEQYQFLRLLEKYWLKGVEEDGVTPLTDTGNQISYTMKYDPEVVNFERFLQTLMDGQFSIKCCSVMPQVDSTAFEYQPEEPITHDRYMELMAQITHGEVKEDIGLEHVDCGAGACPI
ncbi:hypothetical protein PXK56_17750, partial [Phaeobacter gallaeciensis]|uniref:hypothetical protein n=1 Tax=Phaeobacter gallaeciensis TaxID=60890 RepID=UPI00238054F2